MDEHKFGPYIFEPKSCNFTRICKRCGKNKTGEKHDIDKTKKRYLEDCRIVYTCERCQGEFRTKKPKHDFSAADYYKPNNCSMIRHCKRCGLADKIPREKHQFSDWKCLKDNPCVLLRKCSRCGIWNSKVEHRWGKKKFQNQGDCMQWEKCENCGKERKTGEYFHYWDSIPRWDSRGNYIECKRCWARRYGI